MSASERPGSYADVVCDTINANLRNPGASLPSSPTCNPLIASVTGTVKWADGTETGFTVYPDSESNYHQNSGPNGADLSVYSLGDEGGVLETLADALREYQAANTPTHHYHVGANIPGYLPDGDVGCYIDQDDAREALKETLVRASETLPECVNPVDSAENDNSLCEDTACVACTSIAALEQFEKDVIDQADPAEVDSDGLMFDLNDGRSLPVRYWLTRVPASDCQIEQEA
jgi:hypothetical protein